MPIREPKTDMLSTAQPTIETAAEQYNFLFSDFLLPNSDGQKMINTIEKPILATGDGLEEGNLIHVFDSQEAFDAWARGTDFAERLAKIDFIIADTRHQREMQIGTPEPSPVGPKLVSNKSLDELSSKPSSQTSTASSTEVVDRAPAAIIYEEENYQGQWYPVSATAIPNLANVEMYNKVSSLKVSGICLLTDQTYFNGMRLYIIGSPMVEVPSLKAWGFDKVAASAIIV
jgi:hypothetical protein